MPRTRPGGKRIGMKAWFNRTWENLSDTVSEIEWTSCQDCFLGGMRNVLICLVRWRSCFGCTLAPPVN